MKRHLVAAKKYLFSLILNHPIRLVTVSLLLTIVCCLGLYFNFNTDYSPKVWFQKNNFSLLNYERFEEYFGSDDVVVIGLKHPDGILKAENIKAIQKLSRELMLVHSVISVESITNYSWAQSSDEDLKIDPLFPEELNDNTAEFEKRTSEARSNKTLEGFLVNKDHSTTVIYATLKPSFDFLLPYTDIYKDVQEKLAPYRALGFEAHIAGLVSNYSGIEKNLTADVWLLLPLTLFLLALIIYFLFGTVLPVLQILLTVLASTFSVAGLVCWLGGVVDPMSTNYLMVMTAICVADAVHLISSYYQYLERGCSSKISLLRSLSKNLRPTILTSVTTAIGFFGLCTSEVPPISRFGLWLGIGCIAAWFFTFFFTAPLVFVFSPRKRLDKHLIMTRNFHSYFHGLKKHRSALILAFACLFAAGSYLSTTIEINGDPSRYFRDDHPVHLANQFFKNELGGHSVLEVVVSAPAEQSSKHPDFLLDIENFRKDLIKETPVFKTRSLGDIVKDVNKAMTSGTDKDWVIPQTKEEIGQSLFLYELGLPPEKNLNLWNSIDHRKVRVSASIQGNSTREVLSAIDEIQQVAQKNGLQTYVTGKTQLYAQINPLMIQTFFNSIAVTLVIVSVIMGIFFRSWLIGLVSMIPNILPLLVGAIAMSLLDFPLDAGTAAVTSISLGIAVDDTIHILSEYLKQRKLGLNEFQAMQKTFEKAGRAVTITTILLSTVFVSYSIAHFVPSQEIGILLGIIITFALATDLILLPLILLLAPRLGLKKAR